MPRIVNPERYSASVFWTLVGVDEQMQQERSRRGHAGVSWWYCQEPHCHAMAEEMRPMKNLIAEAAVSS